MDYNMINHFNSNIAVEYGINTAIFVQQLSQWTFLNLANKHHIYDGYAWSFNTLDAYEEIFPYWSRRQLERIIAGAIADGMIIKENYNKNKYDRTCWYALTYKGMCFFPELIKEKHLETLYSSISPNGEMEFSEWRNGVLQTVTPIPTNNSTSKDISKDISTPETEVSNKPKKSVLQIEDLLADNPHSIPEPMLEDWLTIRKGKKAKVTRTAWSAMNKTLILIQEQAKVSPVDAFEKMVANAWQSMELKYFVKGANDNDKQVSFPGKGKQNEAEIYGWK